MNNSIEIYTGFWFPLGINNILAIGKELSRFNEIYIAERSDYRGGDEPYREGDSIVWRFFVSIANQASPNYQVEIVLRWHGSGFLQCRASFTVRQDGHEIHSLVDVPASVVKETYNVLEQYLTDIFIECALPHQQNYARNILFGHGLSTALNNYNIEDVDFLPKDLQAKLTEIKAGKLMGATNNDIRKGIGFLLTRVLVFSPLSNVNISDFDDDFRYDDNFRKRLPEEILYVKGKSLNAYDLKRTSTSNKYSEKRGNIAIDKRIAADGLISYLLGLNSLLQFSSMLSYELVKLRESISKARIFLLRYSAQSDIISDFVEILEAKLPLYKELVEFIELDALGYINRLRNISEVSENITKLSESDAYIGDYFAKLEDYIRTLERIAHGLSEEIFALNEFLTINTQQRQTELAQESKAAATRSLDTQTTLTEFQRAAVLKGRKTKWLSAFTLAAAIAAGTGLFETLAIFSWNILVKSRPFIVSVLGGDATRIYEPPMPKSFQGIITILGVIFVALIIGKFIIYIEGKIPDIIQYSFNLNESEISYNTFKGFLGAKSIKTLRETEHSFQITWTKRIPIWLDLVNNDVISSSGRIEKIYFRIINSIERKIHPLKQTKRQAVCTLNCGMLMQDGEVESITLYGLTISVERNQREITEAYIYPIHLEAAEILCDLLKGKKGMGEFILDITKADAFDEFRRGKETIKSIIEQCES